MHRSRDASKPIGGRGHSSPDLRLNADAPPSVTLARRAFVVVVAGGRPSKLRPVSDY